MVNQLSQRLAVILGQLKSEGSVAGGRRKIVLTNPQRLADSVNRRSPREPRPELQFSRALAAV